MTALTFSQALNKYRIAVTPMLRKTGRTTWIAGVRMINGDGITNLIDPQRKVEGKSNPEDALRDLLQLLNTGDILVGDDEPEPVSAPAKPEPEPIQLYVTRAVAISETPPVSQPVSEAPSEKPKTPAKPTVVQDQVNLEKEPLKRASDHLAVVPCQSNAITEEGGVFFLRLDDGRIFKASRRRDLIRRAKQAGVTV
jgi:hypothetical protein